MNFRILILFLVLLAAPVSAARGAERPPNFVILFADDLGYGDLGCNGHPTIRTPNLDRMAHEGMKFTQFYTMAAACSASRYALMTGRLPWRSGFPGWVLGPKSQVGIRAEEVTLAEALHARGYATACIGKWHLGDKRECLPLQNGFDEYFGLPYSNDMARPDWPVPLMRGNDIVEQPAVQETLTPRYTAEAVRFIEAHREQPFFVYLPYTFPHVPLHASEKFKGKSARGLYGDVVEELDWSVGQILDTLRTLGLAEQTLVFFSSDNGPWLRFREKGGSAGLFRDGKGSNWEGGIRVPGLAWMPGRVPAGVVQPEIACTMDLLPTCVALAGAPLPDRKLDGVDLRPLLFQQGSPLPRMLRFYDSKLKTLHAVRKAPWKLHVVTSSQLSGRPPQKQNPPLLFHVEHDPSERHNVAAQHPDVVKSLLAEIAELENAK